MGLDVVKWEKKVVKWKTKKAAPKGSHHPHKPTQSIFFDSYLPIG
jgi:hypothetical protein